MNQERGEGAYGEVYQELQRVIARPTSRIYDGIALFDDRPPVIVRNVPACNQNVRRGGKEVQTSVRDNAQNWSAEPMVNRGREPTNGDA